MVCDSVTLINKLASDPECMILVEGAQSCMLDVDFGTYPHVTSSNCTVGGVCTGLGLPPTQIGSGERDFCSLAVAPEIRGKSVLMNCENGYLMGEVSNVVVVTGAQWGDEGKGKLVDLLSENANVVCRCQGGNNAGHTVVRDGQEFFFHLIPSGMVNPGALGIIGNGTVVNLPGLFEEIKEATSKGLLNLEKRLHISDRCHIVFDLHQAIDKLEEEIRGTGSIGTTKKGIGPAYSSKITRNGIRMCDLLGDWEHLVKKYTELVRYAERRYPKLNVNVEDSLEVGFAIFKL
ncbi:hypothetical protein AHF37_11509 [Paragonimus kellicotti]|nr:hypothetical protein AHF37_11509 [Paragonimus kellicotti]